jgi:hypothetical protein
MGASPALAHYKHDEPPSNHYPPIQGMLTAVDAGSLQVQTQTGSVTVPTTGSTHVVRIVSGSLADLHVNQQVDVHLIQGTKTIDRIQIDGSKWYKLNHPHADDADSPDAAVWAYMRTAPKPRSMSPHSTPRATLHPAAPPSNYVSGQVVSIGRNSITLAGWNGKQTTYTLNGSLVVTKIMNGTQGDLLFGETVRVTRDQNGNAKCVVILSA